MMKTIRIFAAWGIMAVLMQTCAGNAHSQEARGSAIALPLTGITIDGRIDDWPDDMERHPILHHGQAYGPTDIDTADLTSSPDLTPSFMIGYDRRANLIYLAVIVRDDILAAGYTFMNTDACEIYVEGTQKGRVVEFNHSLNFKPENMAAIQYVLCPPGGSYDSPQAVGTPRNPRISGGDIGDTKTTGAFSRDGDISIYEWAIQAFEKYPSKPTVLTPGTYIGLDVVVNDVDREGERPAWVCWSMYKPMKFYDATSLGSVLIVDDPSDIGSISGRVTDKRDNKPIGGFHFEIYRDGELKRTAVTDSLGAFALKLTKGGYAIRPKAGQGVETGTLSKFTVKGGRDTKVAVSPKFIAIPDEIAESSKYYASLTGYSDTTVVVTTFSGADGSRTLRKKYSLDFNRPAFIRFKTAGGDSNTVSLHAFEQVMLVYDEAELMYSAQRPPESLEKNAYRPFEKHLSNDSSLLLEWITAPDPLKELMKSAVAFKKAGRETIDGEETIIIDVMASLDAVSPKAVGKNGETTAVRLWIGARDRMLRKASYSIVTGDEKKPSVMKVEILHSSMASNPEFADNHFMFSPEPGSQPMGAVSRAQSQKPKSVDLTGSDAPDFDLPLLGGGTVSLSGCKGNAVVIGFWASWSEPCGVIMPVLQKIHDAYGDKNVTVIGIDTLEDEEEDVLKAFLVDHGVTFANAIDEEQKLADAYHLTKIPSCFFVDKKGAVVYAMQGDEFNPELAEKIVEALAKN